MLNKLFIAIILSIASIKTYANNQIDCLAKAMYFESRGGEAHEQLNVGHVILNRVESGKFPGSVCGVVADRKHSIQFPWYYKGRKITDWNTFKEIKILADILYASYVIGDRVDTTRGSLFFHSRTIDPKWKYRKVALSDSLHYFYKLR